MIRRILIVEPNPGMARDLFLLFHREYNRFADDRYEPELATSLAEAIEEVQNTNFHCLIMDAILPEMNVDEAIPLMRTMNNAPPIVITTGTNTLELETRVREQDVYYYHIRCFGTDELKLAVAGIFEELPKIRTDEMLHKKAASPTLLKQLRPSTKKSMGQQFLMPNARSRLDEGSQHTFRGGLYRMSRRVAN